MCSYTSPTATLAFLATPGPEARAGRSARGWFSTRILASFAVFSTISCCHAFDVSVSPLESRRGSTAVAPSRRPRHEKANRHGIEREPRLLPESRDSGHDSRRAAGRVDRLVLADHPAISGSHLVGSHH